LIKEINDMKHRRVITATAALVAILTLAGTSLWAYGRGPGYGKGYGKGYGDCRGQGYHGRGYRQGPGKRGGGMAYLQEELKLSDSQVDKIMDINHEYRKKFYNNRENEKTLARLHDDRIEAVEKVLNKDQVEKWKEMRQNRPCTRYGPGR
jgi:Spy/CpxP family protein refolding chaperone